MLLFDAPEKIRKLKVFLMFLGESKWNIGKKGLRKYVAKGYLLQLLSMPGNETKFLVTKRNEEISEHLN